MIGTLRADEVILPILSMRLISEVPEQRGRSAVSVVRPRGGVEFMAATPGPVKPCRGPVRVFTASGMPVTENADGESTATAIPEVRAGDTLTLTYTVWFATYVRD